MAGTVGRAARIAALAACMSLPACGGGHRQMQAAADSMAVQHDSAMQQMDSGRTPTVDTTKLGAAKTESVLTAQRKKKP